MARDLQKARTPRWCLIALSVIAIQALLLGVLVWLVLPETYGFSWAYYVVWPSVILAQSGLSHTWVVSAVLVPVIVGGSIYVVASWRPWFVEWKKRLAFTVAGTASYLLVAWVTLERWPLPQPDVIPSDLNATDQEEYIQGFKCGYRMARFGWSTSGPLADRITSYHIGISNGLDSGGRVYDRMVGSEDGPDRVPSRWIWFVGEAADQIDDSLRFLRLLWD